MPRKTVAPKAPSPALDPDTIVLTSGAHDSPEQGACVMELASFLAHEPWSDHPACACPVIATFLRTWNDQLDDATRQRLKPYAARVVGSRSTSAVEQKRAWLITARIVREHTAAWLETAKLTEQAAALRALPELTPTTIAGAMSAFRRAQTKAAAARAAARAAAWAAARDATYSEVRQKADAALQPTAERLRESAFGLLDRMLAVQA